MADFHLMEENLRETLGTFARAKEIGRLRELPGLVAGCSGVDFPMFNAAVLTSHVETASELEERIAAAGGEFRRCGLRWSLWVCEGWLSPEVKRGLSASCQRQGLHFVVDLPGMAAERLLPPVRSLPEIEIQRVSDDSTRLAFAELMSASFGLPFGVAREIYGAERTWRNSMRGYVGLVEGEAVSSVATVVTGGVAGVYSVATLPSLSRRGYAEAMVRHALEEARQETGIEKTVLQSSAEGYPLYRRMGYETATRYVVYAV